IPDKRLLRTATFVLAVRAQVPDAEIRRTFPQAAIVSSIERNNELLAGGVHGIGLSAAERPPQIPYHADYVYFVLDSRSPYWADLPESAGIAIQVTRPFPGLQLELWALRS